MSGKTNWRRTFAVVWLANLITSIGMMSFLPFFPSLLRELGLENPAEVRLWAGLCFGAAPLSATLMSPVWGSLGDRLGRKVMVVRAMLAISLFVGGMAYVSTPAQLLAMRVGQGLFSGFIPPSITLVSVVAPPERQGRVAGWLTTSLAIGGMFGPLLGGWATLRFGSHQSVFLLVGAMALTGALLVSLFAFEDKSMRLAASTGGRSPVANALRSLRGDLAEVLASPVLRGTLALVFALQLGLGAVNPVLEDYVAELFAGVDPAAQRWSAVLRGLSTEPLATTKEVGTFATSLAFGVMAVANLVSLPLWGRYGDQAGHRKALILCTTSAIGALALQAAVPTYPALLAGRLLLGAALAGVGPLAFGLAAAETGADRRGGAFGAVFSARTLAVAIGGAAGGAMAGGLGIRAVMASGCAVMVLALGVFLRRRD